jgi:hypothetical protein
LPGEGPRKAAFLQAGKLPSRRTGHAYREIKPILQCLFEEQGHFDHPALSWFGGKGASPCRKDQRVRQILQPEPLDVVGKHPLREHRTVDAAVRPNHHVAVTVAECSEDLLLNQDLLPDNLVGIQPAKTTWLKELRGSRLPTTKPPGDAKNHDTTSVPRFGLAGGFSKFLITARPSFGSSPARQQPLPYLTPAMFPPVDTKDAAAVSAFTSQKFAAMYPAADGTWIAPLFQDILHLFEGGHPDFLPIDLHYHDLEHTLQATVCLVLLLEGRHGAAANPRIDARQFQLALSAVMLHDTGYLKLRSDTAGTGAKYTFCHVLRSCAFATSYLPTRGITELELETVLGAINCTGPTKEVSRLRFRNDGDLIVGCAVGTADYLGQMAAPDYPDELEFLYREFEECDDYLHLPGSKRAFCSAADLIERTPAFWREFVLPKLEGDFQGVYRFLARPFPSGTNGYMDGVERNIAVLSHRMVTCRPPSTAAAPLSQR